jgi:hypothetical protein
MNRNKQAAALARLLAKYARKAPRTPENGAIIVSAMAAVVSGMKPAQDTATVPPGDDKRQSRG